MVNIAILKMRYAAFTFLYPLPVTTVKSNRFENKGTKLKINGIRKARHTAKNIKPDAARIIFPAALFLLYKFLLVL